MNKNRQTLIEKKRVISNDITGDGYNEEYFSDQYELLTPDRQ